ncbi:MAG: sulfatase [Deltaproteobacteria bacterium]|nr:sulfatase [Deltaproteobacteria bacterium]
MPATRAGTFDHPRAQIDDDTRLVLAAPPSALVMMRRQLAIAPTGALRDTVPVDEALAGASRVLLTPRARLGAAWTELPARIAQVDDRGGEPRVTVDLQFPQAMAGRQVEQLVVRATAIDWGPRISLRTAPLALPKNARLELATGILEPGWRQGPVRFVVEACEGQACAPLYETLMDPARESDRRWRDASVALDSYAGETVSLRFRSELSSAAAEEFSLPVWANPTILVPGKSDRSAPNVVLLSIDTLSAGHLPTYGYFRDTAPVLARAFELGGTVFDNCVAAATSTPQAHMSIFTGLYPLEHGITAGTEVLDPAILTIAEQVRAAGVATGAVTEDGWLGAEAGFGRGFDEYRENKSADVMEPAGQVDKTFRAAKAWLTRHADQRFFLFLHTFQVHDPYAPPAKYASLFPTDDQGRALGADAPSHVREAANYDREIRYVDDELGSLLAAMGELALDENTVFIVASDHGEAFLEHGFLRHSTFAYEEVTHVPLLMRGPGIPHGLRVSFPVGHVDLARTVASFFDVDPPRGARGVDLRRTLREGNSPLDGAFYFTESWGAVANGPGGAPIAFFAPAFSVRQGERKAARYRNGDGSARSECYDLANDPAERANLCAGATSEPTDLAATLDAYQEVAARHRAQLLLADGARTEEPRPAPVDPEREEKLRALGYVR